MRVGIVSRTATYWPFYLAQSEALFAREALVVELVELGRTSAGVPALLDGAVDVAATCPDALIVAASAGAALRIAGGLVDRPPASLVSVPEVREIAQLRGRRVAITEPRGSVSLMLRALLRAHGLAPAENGDGASDDARRKPRHEVGEYSQVVCGPTPAQAAALESGAVEAAMLSFPFDVRLVGRGFRLLVRAGDALGSCAFTTLNVRLGWSTTVAWRRLRRAVDAAAEVLNDRSRPARAVAILAEVSGADRSSLEEALAASPIAYDTRVDLGGLERLLGFMREEGLSRAPPESPRVYLDAEAVVR